MWIFVITLISTLLFFCVGACFFEESFMTRYYEEMNDPDPDDQKTKNLDDNFKPADSEKQECSYLRIFLTIILVWVGLALGVATWVSIGVVDRFYVDSTSFGNRFVYAMMWVMALSVIIYLYYFCCIRPVRKETDPKTGRTVYRSLVGYETARRCKFDF
jgi:hypothetical protein